MYVYYQPNDKTVPGIIVGRTEASSPNDEPGEYGNATPFYLDDTQYANVAANLGGYKIVGTPLAVVALTTAETSAIQAAYVAPAPTTDEKVNTLQKDHNLVKLSNDSNTDTLNSLIDTLSAKGLI